MPRVISSERIYTGRVLSLRLDDLDTRRGTYRKEIVEHKGAVAIIALPAPGKIVLVRQYRHAAGRALWEIPAGSIEAGELPEPAAARELAEETGYRAAAWRRLWSAYTAVGFCTELMYFFVAEGLTAGEPEPDDYEDIEVRTFAIDEAWAMVERDELPDAKTQIGLFWARSNR
jgi:ADP-ribose pyrophosphatase